MAPSSKAPSAPSVASDPVDLSHNPYSLARAVYARRSEYTRPHQARIKIGTWNVAACPGTDKDLARWFVDGKGLDENFSSLHLTSHEAIEKDHGAARVIGGDHIGLYVLGLQEVVDLNSNKEYMTRAVYTDNSAKAKWQAALEAAMPSGYQLIVAEQMFGLLLLIYASPKIAPTIGNVSTKQISTGLAAGWFANKGAVSARIVLGETTRMAFTNCHLASGVTSASLDRRCADVSHILSKTQFDPVVTAGVEEDEGDHIGNEEFAFWFGDLNYRLDGLPGNDIRRLLTLHTTGEYDVSKTAAPMEGEGVIVMRTSESDDDTATTSSIHSKDQSFDSDTSLPDPDDFPEDPSLDPTSLQSTLDSLLPHDQLKRMMRERKAFHDGWREGPITFLPSYKYDVGTVGLFDSSEKKRAPSWCDRILYRTRRDKEEHVRKRVEEEDAKKKDEEMRKRGIEEDDDVLFSYDPDADGEEPSKDPAEVGYDEYDEYDENEDPGTTEVVTKDGFKDSIKLGVYTSHQRITSSDHKPIDSVFTLDYDAVVPALKAIVHAELARELDRAENEGRPGITVISEGGQGYDESAVDFGELQYLERKTCSLTVANTGGVPATFMFVERPGEEVDDIRSEWLITSFLRPDGDETAMLGKSVVLEPGETVLALVSACITSTPLIRSLNEGEAKIEEVLVLRVENGRDHFIPIRGAWQPSCFGRSIDELIRVPDGGIRAFYKDWKMSGSIPYDAEQRFSAPKELFKITAALESLSERCVADEAMLEEVTLPKDPGWPFDMSTWTCSKETLESLGVSLVTALDTDKPLLESLPIETLSSQKLEALAHILILFLSSLTDGIIPTHVWAKLAITFPHAIPTTSLDIKTQILDVLSTSPNHNVAFVFLTATLSRMASELSSATTTPPPSRRLSFRRSTVSGKMEEEVRKRRAAREKKYAEIVAPLVCRTTEKDRAKAKTIVEVCIQKGDD